MSSRLGVNVNNRLCRVRQYKNPSVITEYAKPVNEFSSCPLRFLGQDPHYSSFMFPRTCHGSSNHRRNIQAVNYTRKLQTLACQELKYFCKSKHSIKSRLKTGEDETSVSVSCKQDFLPRPKQKLHKRPRILPRPEHLSPEASGDFLNRPRSVHCDSDSQRIQGIFQAFRTVSGARPS